ncbi:MAG: PaaI family thioesterase [Armatimonadetes bacterium]|nr:PaaI family thioesterase [Armatimonadota bacterium]
MTMHEPPIYRLPHSHRCFVCGDVNTRGLNVRFMTDGEKVWTTLTPTDPYMGYAGILHGGILATLLDETMGWAPAVHTGRFCMAVELNIEYRRSVPIGGEITVTGWMTDVSKRIWEGRGEVRGTDGTLYVRGRGRFIPLSEAATDEVIDMLVFDEGTLTREQILAARAGTARAADSATVLPAGRRRYERDG